MLQSNLEVLSGSQLIGQCELSYGFGCSLETAFTSKSVIFFVRV